MKFYFFILRYRLQLSIVLLLAAIGVQWYSSFWPAFILYFIAVIGVVSHFVIGPLRLAQEPMERGDIKAVEKIINSIYFPGLLYTPIRSTYYTLKGNLAMMQQDFSAAEKHMKKSIDIGSAMPEAEGANKLQLGLMAMQRGDFKLSETYIKSAIKAGLPDKENQAVAFLSMCQIYMNRREFRAAKDFFRRAKALKPTTKEVVNQIKEIEKYITRVPG